ncbi:RDD family protein [Mucilaginibacter litoreus]|uniref:RDD family protein n=1 Tax=Mucilaginibacter litoreus TaxID=1048221 RepID=A0ABW3AR69_9SPHI
MKFYIINPKPYFLHKVLATLIDYAIYFVVYYVYIYVFNESTEPGKMIVNNLMVLPLILFWFIYFVVLEAANSCTPGHDILKLKVYKTDGGKPSFSDVLKRRLLDPIDIFMYGIPAFISISKTDKHQRLGDLWADTVVIKPADITVKEVTF